MKMITVEIENGGQTKISVSGMKGKGCHALTKDIEDALGKVSARKNTPDYHKAATATEKAIQR